MAEMDRALDYGPLLVGVGFSLLACGFFALGVFQGMRWARDAYDNLNRDYQKLVDRYQAEMDRGVKKWWRAKNNRRRCLAAIDTLRGTRALLKRAEQRIERLEASEQATKEAEKVARDELKRLRDDLYHLLNPDAPRVTVSGRIDGKDVVFPVSNGSKYPIVRLPDPPVDEEPSQDWRERFPIASRWKTKTGNVVTVLYHDGTTWDGYPLVCVDQYGKRRVFTTDGIAWSDCAWNIIERLDEVEAPF